MRHNIQTKNALNHIDDHYDVLTVGGGIVGAGVFRDLALHGVKTLIIDKKDFSSQTSRYSSKMLHGGIRYLENFDFSLVWEALHEKNLWLKLTPHLAVEKRFYLPVFKSSKRPLWMIHLGLTLYDLLSSGQNTPHKMADINETLKHLPGLNESELKGSGVYSDAVVDDLKLTLEVIYDGLLEKNQAALNHVSIEAYKRIENGKYLVTLKDELSEDTREITCHDIVFATGPFTDQLLLKLGLNWTEKLLKSRGSHIWLKLEDLPIKSPLVMTTQDHRVIFVIPNGKRLLVGTTEVEASEDLFDPKPSQEEIQYLLNSLKEYFPKFDTNSEILGSFAGIRPLVKDEGSDLGKTSREHRYFRPKKDIHVLIGGKYTTFRTMAQDVSSIITKKYGKVYNSNRTKAPLRQKSVIGPQDYHTMSVDSVIEKLPQIIARELVRTKQDVINRTYPWPDQLKSAEKVKSWLEENHSNF